MQEDWPTAQEDLHIANTVIKKYIDLLQDDEQLPMPHILLRSDSYPSYWAPDWMLELAEIFGDRYGLIQGDYVTRRVLTHYLLQGNTIH